MKIAFCIAGLFKPSTTYSNAYEHKFEYIRSQIKKYNADVFIHSFSKEIEHEIISLFEPKDFLFELQKNFDEEINQINQILDKIEAKKVFSQFFSRKKVCEIKKKFEIDNCMEYDIVVLCRADLGYIKTENFEIPDLYKIDENYLYSINWNQLNAGLADWFFISNSKNINFISQIYDNVLIYLKENSEYQKCITGGFPYSNCENRFSQELFQAHPKNSEIIQDIYMLNNHVLIKYFLLENNKFSLDFLKF